MLTEILPVKLTETEIRERGIKLAGVLQDIGKEETAKKDAASAAKSRIDLLETEATKIAFAIRAGQEDREIQVEEQKDYEAQEVRTARLDTGEIVHRRAMTPKELQRPLPIEEARSKKKTGPKEVRG